jgi:hypothetical protein
MFAITLADLRFRYRQFLIAVVGTGVVLAMAVMLSGLADGSRSEIRDTVGAVGADRWVLSAQAHARRPHVQVSQLNVSLSDKPSTCVGVVSARW